MKLVRLEKEAAEYERVKEDLRTASAKVAELDKTNKKLYAQAHADKKTIIKLNEVGYMGMCGWVGGYNPFYLTHVQEMLTVHPCIIRTYIISHYARPTFVRIANFYIHM